MRKLFFLFFLTASLLFAELLVKEWQQQTNLSPAYINQQLNIQLQAEIPANSFYTSWSFIFDPLQRISIKEVKVNNSTGNYDFKDNQLKINFDKLSNGQTVQIVIKYQEQEENNNNFYLQQYSSIPRWVKGAKGQLNITLSDNFDICSAPDFLQKNNNTFSWTGIVPANGLETLFKYTPKKNHWQLEKKIKISGSGTSQGFEIYLPLYFQTGQNNLISQETISSVPELNSEVSGNYKLYKFKTLETIFLTVKAQLETGKEFYKFNFPVKEEYTSLSQKNYDIAKQLASNILRTKSKIPNYIRLANWVNENITYDYGYNGQEMSLQQILATRKGVCQHYSQLYKALCRAIDIPALEISGYAYSNGYNGAPAGWGPHSWILIFINDHWLQIDPTWGITSGVMPISHIAFYFEETNPYSYMLRNYYGRIFVNEDEITIQEIK